MKHNIPTRSPHVSRSLIATLATAAVLFVLSTGACLAKWSMLLPGQPNDSFAVGVSGNATAIIGLSIDDQALGFGTPFPYRAWRWTPSQGFTFLTNPPSGNPLIPFDLALIPSQISDDGKTMAGKIYFPPYGDWNLYSTAIWRWTERDGVQVLGVPPHLDEPAEGTLIYTAWAYPFLLSSDGATIAGDVDYGWEMGGGFIWNTSTGFVDLNPLWGNVSVLSRDGSAASGNISPWLGGGLVNWTLSGGVQLGPLAQSITPASSVSLALDGSVSTSISTDETIDPQVGYAHFHVYVTADRPVVEKFTPAQAVAVSADVAATFYGLGFEAGTRVFFGATEVATTYVGPTQLQVVIPASALPAPADFTTVPITVLCPGGDVSKPVAFTVIGSGVSGTVGQVQSSVAAAGETVSVQTPPSTPADAGVTASLQNTTGTTPATVTAATYTENPTPAPAFEVGGGFVDLKVSGADAGDRLTSSFYYPQTATGAAETALTLKFFNGTVWIDVLSSGGVAPIKNTQDNLDSTQSGGRFQVLFDNTSTPKITELNGTVFAVAVPDTIAPTLTCPNVTVPCNVNLLVPVTYPAPAVHDNIDPEPRVTYSIPSGSGFKVGTTTVTCTATDAAGNSSSTTFTVTRGPLEFDGFADPIEGADSTGGSYANPARTLKLGNKIRISFELCGCGTTASTEPHRCCNQSHERRAGHHCSGSHVTTGIHTLQVVKWTSQTDSETPLDADSADPRTEGNEFRLVGHKWVFVLDTRDTGMTRGKWQIVATLSDGSQHTAWVQMK